MAGPSKRSIVAALFERYPQTFAHDAGVRRLDTPSGLFQLLVMALLMSARISSDLAMRGTRALFDAGWTTAEKMHAATWEERTRTLNRSGYARYDESTSRMLGETSELVLDRYRGDLRRLRDEADRDPAAERRLLKQCKGIGDVGADIFFREVQSVWTELRPFVDRRALQAAERLGLGTDARAVAGLVDPDDVAQLAGALVRAELDDAIDEILSDARG